MCELLVRIIKVDGSVECFNMSADSAVIEGCSACARLCPNTCIFWRVSENVWCVVYTQGV